MLSRKVKKILVGILLITSLIGVTSCVANKTKDQEPQTVYRSVMVLDDKQEVLEAETIVESLNECISLNVLNISMQKEIKITEGDWFKKSQNIKFQINGDYILDLSSITTDNIQIDTHTQTIKIYSKPLEYRIYFDEAQTKFSETEKAFYVWGDVEVSPEKMEQIKVQLKTSAIEDMDEEIEYAEECATRAIKDTLSKLTKNEYDIQLIMVK